MESALKDWTVVKLSERCFSLSGRQWTHTDVCRLWQIIGHKGHVFLFDLQSGQEYYRQKGVPMIYNEQRKPNNALDSQTVLLVDQFLQDALSLESHPQE